MKILITGASGFVGQATIVHLAKAGHTLTAVTRRHSSTSHLPCKSIVWDAAHDSPENLAQALVGMDAVIHLAGEPVASQRWTPEKKELIRSSRILSTKKIVEAIALLPSEARPKKLICASAIGYYGDRGNETLTESSLPGKDFLSEVVIDWEKEAGKAELHGTQVALLRIGVVLGKQGGALEKMLPSTLGNGQQWMSWIHLDDLVRLITFCLDHPNAIGPINAVTNAPVQNETFTKELAVAKHQVVLPPAPKAILTIVLGEMAQVILASSKVLPEKANLLGFNFHYPTLKEALREIYEKLKPGESSFSAVQFIPKNKNEVFEFFSKAENLETITPPWLNFKIAKKSTPQIQEGTLIDYKLKIHGIPAYWRTKIERWSPPNQFIDTQLKGPYSKWHHTHRFEEIPGGTLMSDEVIYKLPAGKLGSLFGSPFVKKDISEIFNYRKNKIEEIFKNES